MIFLIKILNLLEEYSLSEYLDKKLFRNNFFLDIHTHYFIKFDESRFIDCFSYRI